MHMNPSFGDHVKVAMEGHVAVVTLSRPPHNFISTPFARSIADAFEAADADPAVRALVLQADGKSFTAGADLAAPRDPAEAAAGEIPSLYVETLRLYSTVKPVVAAVQGPAVGAGLGLALVADFRIVTAEARFTANFVKLGFHPGFGITHALPRLIGGQKAALIMLTGRRIKGDEAVEWGLADELAAPDELRPRALQLAQEIAENAPLAIVATRRTLRAGLAEAIREQTKLEFREQRRLQATEDFAEGVRAVAERRPGNFVGR
jgi:enoyl-CoA hydratase/carnithine racemase